MKSRSGYKIIGLNLLFSILIGSGWIDTANAGVVFENRAACAIDSKKPTTSAFLIVDSYNAGKVIDSWIKGNPQARESVSSVDQGLKWFRLSLTEIWMTIMNEILSGRLPLLNEHSEADVGLIFQTWKNLPEGETLESRPSLQRGRSDPKARCIFIKKFSELQSNWNLDRPDQQLLQKMALASLRQQDFITDCFDDSDHVSSRRFILQLDIEDTTKRNWKRNGFDFWFSMKTYFSHAWRHPELILGSSHPLIDLFKNLSIEQMILLVSNGCASIERPECSISNASMDLFRSLAVAGTPTALDHPLHDRVDQTILKGNVPIRHDDASILPIQRETEDWLKEFQNRVVQKRGLLKQKLLLAISQFEILSGVIRPDKLSSDLDSLKKNISSNPLAYQKLMVLCSEVDIAARPNVNFLEQRFKTVPDISKFKLLVEGASDLQLQSMMDFYFSVIHTAFPFCERIRNEKLWRSVISVPNHAYSDWYLDLIGKWDSPATPSDSVSPTVNMGMGNLFNGSTSNDSPYLVQVPNQTICKDAGDCVRMLLKSMVDLYSISSWTEAMMPAKEWIQSPNLANPWSTASACKTYDPWFATKQAMVGLLSDLITTTTTGVLPVPGYLAVQPRQRNVTEFIPDPRGDDLFLKPVRSGSSFDLTVGMDLGPWSGIPCSAVYTPTSNRPIVGGYYSVAGVRLEACVGSNQNRLIVRGSATSATNLNRTNSGCFICFLNPYSVANGVASIASIGNPALKVAIGAVFSGISFAKKMGNKVDIPKRFDVDLDQLEETYERFRFIPKRCVRRLSKGRSCRHVILTKSERKQDPQ